LYVIHQKDQEEEVENVALSGAHAPELVTNSQKFFLKNVHYTNVSLKCLKLYKNHI